MLKKMVNKRKKENKKKEGTEDIVVEKNPEEKEMGKSTLRKPNLIKNATLSQNMKMNKTKEKNLLHLLQVDLSLKRDSSKGRKFAS